MIVILLVPSTVVMVTDASPTFVPGCYVNGEFYPPGEKISSGQDVFNNWCYGTFCGDDGSIIYWDNFDCFSTTTTTLPPGKY